MTPQRKYLTMVIALSMLLSAGLAYSQKVNEESPSAQEPVALIESLEGRDLFRAYCAGCHGLDGRGGGARANALKTKPPDLTGIARRRGGAFPLLGVERIIAGEETSAQTHATREMPVWGPILGQIQRDQSLGKVRIRNLAKYLETLQGR
jgi:mono/diheme cytochrome c family protein